MKRLLTALALLVAVLGFADPHSGAPKQPEAKAPANPGRDRTEKPLFDPYPATLPIDCQDMEKARKAVQEMREKRNEQLIAASHLPSVDAMKKILATSIDSMRQGEVRPERKEKEKNEFLEMFGLNAKPAPEASAVLKTAVELLDSPSYPEREIATRFLSGVGPKLLREKAFIDGVLNASPEQSTRLKTIKALVLKPTAISLSYDVLTGGELETLFSQFFSDQEWKQLWNSSKAEPPAPREEVFLLENVFLKIGEKHALEGITGFSDQNEPNLRFNAKDVLRRFGEKPNVRAALGRVIFCEDRLKWQRLELRVTSDGRLSFLPYDEVSKLNGPVARQVALSTKELELAPMPKAAAQTHVSQSARTVAEYRKHLANLVSSQLEANSPSSPTASDLAWLGALKEVREKAGFDKTDGKPEDSVAPLIKALASDDFHVRYLARELLEFYGPSLAKHPAWVDATKYPGEWSPTLRTSIVAIQTAHAAVEMAPKTKK